MRPSIPWAGLTLPLTLMLTPTLPLTLALPLTLMSSPVVAAETQIRPFAGATFGGGTTFFNLEAAAGKPNIVYGVTVARMGEIFGADFDFADAPGFFQSNRQNLVVGSRVTTLSGDIIVAAPRRLTEYSLRPYFLGGLGLIRVRADDVFGVLPVAEVVSGMNLGIGVVGFVTNRVGVGWELRRFQTVGGKTQDFSIGREQLSFWRASMALAFKY